VAGDYGGSSAQSDHWYSYRASKNRVSQDCFDKEIVEEGG
jgi:hypothetical protein